MANNSVSEAEMEQSKKNFPKYCIQALMYSVAFMFFNGAIVQTFLLLIGFGESEVYAYSSLMQGAQVLVMLVMIFITDRIRNKRLLAAVANFLIVIPVAIFILGAARPEIMSTWYVIAIFVTSLVSHGGIGMYMVISYCLPYRLINISEYGKFMGISGALGGCITFGLSSLHTLLASSLDYLAVTLWFFILSIASAVLSGVLLLWMKDIPTEESGGESRVSGFIETLKNKDTYRLILPNFTRGLAMGVFNVITVIAISTGVADAAGATFINIITYLASFLASVAFTFFYDKMPTDKLIMLSTAFVSLTLPFVISGGFIPFLLILFVSLLFRFIVDSAIPTALVKIIPESQMGAYNSIRMLIFTGSQAIATAIIMPLVSLVGYTGVLIFAAVMQLICGIGHYAVIRSHRSVPPTRKRRRERS